MYERTEMLLGRESVEKLKNSHVAVFGIGGVGSFICEALARAGVAELTIVDHDIIAESNINRQLHALHSTIGRYKTDVMRERILDINPSAVVHAKKLFYMPSGKQDAIDWGFDYVADAVDTVTAKIHIIETSKANGIRVISSMGTGNKLSPTGFTVADINETSVCPLAKVMRKELRKRGIEGVKVVYSKENPLRPLRPLGGVGCETGVNSRKEAPGSVSFVPSSAGLIIAAEIIRDLCGI